jgi:UDP-N-acetylglucosamine 2-epimerase (non-hydrolysing)/GDP/UDP-N,N'-diacetylbacillosamine 2-epimerase (hydrolysing)
MKKILAITGTRADYGIYKPVLDALEASDQIELSVVVVGMHLLEEFGHTVDQINADGFSIVAELNTMTTEDTKKAMAEYVGKSTQEFTTVFVEQNPDIIFVLGDRGEMLAAATAAVYLQIPIAQLHAGEHSGSVDDPVRHAITQLSTMHLCTTENYAKNVKQMCPEAQYIHTVGAPALDTILSSDFIPKEELVTRFGFDVSKKTVLFLQHPDTTDPLGPEDQLKPSLEALESFDGNILIIGSNADAGGMEMNALLESFADRNDNTYFEISLPHREFLSCENACDVLVGNSSSGIIEAASFNLQVVNIGDRQKGRLRSGNVLDVPYDANAITAGIKEGIDSNGTYENIYGDGKAAERILKIFTDL